MLDLTTTNLFNVQRLIKEGLAEEVASETIPEASDEKAYFYSVKDRARELKANLVGVPQTLQEAYLFARTSDYQALLRLQEMSRGRESQHS